MLRYSLLLLLLITISATAQHKPPGVLTVDGVSITLRWKKLCLRQIDSTRYKLPDKYDLRIGGEALLRHRKITSLRQIKKRDLRRIRWHAGRFRSWEIYLNTVNFEEEDNCTYYLWLEPKE